MIAAAPLMKDRSLSVTGRAILALKSQPSLGITARLKEMSKENSKAKQLVCMLIGELNEPRYAAILEDLLVDHDLEVAALAKETAAGLPVGSSSVYESTDRPHPITAEFPKSDAPSPAVPQRPIISRLQALLKRGLTEDEIARIDALGASEEELNIAIDGVEFKKVSFYSLDQIVWEYEMIQRAKTQKPVDRLPPGARGKARKRTQDCKKCGGTGYLLSKQSVKPCDCKR